MAGLSLNTNTTALQTQRRLGQTTAGLQKSFERLSSGLRINRAADDAAGLSIAESLRTDSRVFNQGLRNLNDGLSISNIAESTLNELANVVTRIQELTEQSANGALSFSQRSALDAEAQALAEEFFRVSRVANFNGLNIFDGSIQDLRLQAGYGSSAAVGASIGGSLGTAVLTTAAAYNGELNSSSDVAAADVNGDGIIDIVTAGTAGAGGAATVRLGVGDGTFGVARSYQGDLSVTTLALNDFNGDGIIDLACGGFSGLAAYVAVRLGRGDGTFAEAASYRAGGSEVYDLQAADVNNDHIADLISVGGAGGYITVFLGGPNGTFQSVSSFAGGDAALALGDVNGDGNQDLMTSHYSCGTVVHLGNGDGTFKAVATLGSLAGISARELMSDDLNGDGRLDIAMLGGAVEVYLGNGDGTFSRSLYWLGTDFIVDADGLAIGDLNGDGAKDILAGSYYSDSTVSVLLGRGDGTFNNAVTYAAIVTAQDYDRVNAIALADIDSDGVQEVLTAGHTFYGSAGMVQILENVARAGVSPIAPFSLQTKTGALQALPMLSKTLNRISAHRGALGAFQSRLASAMATVSAAKENFENARSMITDVDVAQESALLLKSRILQEGASSILSNANQQPALALLLLTG